MIIHITQVKVVGLHSLELTFDNGAHKRVNLSHELYGAVFEPLRDPAYFARAYLDLDSRTVAWPNGADFAPDFLYNLEPETSPFVESTSL
ncbi:MAG TPA: DUF2442 domain-containing protein [Anaerolineae bacterium]|nr:DUF2442 domain-containing protein [Anaerolineae bacterium]